MIRLNRFISDFAEEQIEFVKRKVTTISFIFYKVQKGERCISVFY